MGNIGIVHGGMRNLNLPQIKAGKLTEADFPSTKQVAISSQYRQAFTSHERRGLDGAYSALQQFPAGGMAQLQSALLAKPRRPFWRLFA